MKKKKNPTLTKNMPNVKWKEIPPLRGPDPQGQLKSPKEKRKIFVPLV